MTETISFLVALLRVRFELGTEFGIVLFESASESEVSLLLLIKPRWASLPLSLLSAFVVAGISEMFQLPVFTSGRYATWQDVAIDFLGALSGIGIAVVAVSIVGLIWFKAKPESFKNMKNEFSFLTFKTSFKKQEKIFTDEN